MTTLEASELDLLISFHRTKEKWHHDRGAKLEQMRDMAQAGKELDGTRVERCVVNVPDQGIDDAKVPGKPPVPPKSEPDAPKTAQDETDAPEYETSAERIRWVVQALKDPAPGNDGRTLRGITEHVNEHHGKIIPLMAMKEILDTLVENKMVHKEDDQWIHKNANSKATKVKEDSAKGGSHRGRGGNRNAGLMTPQGEPITRVKAISLILIYAHANEQISSMTASEIHTRLKDQFGDKCEGKTASAALCSMAKREQVFRLNNGNWTVRKPKAV